MPLRNLPPELISLIQHAELNQSGWWERTAQQLVTAVVWASTKRLNVPGIVDELRLMLGVHLQRSTVDSIVKTLCEEKTLVRLPDGCIKVSEMKVRELSKELEEFNQSQEIVKRKFIEEIQPYCPQGVTAEDVWTSFINRFLVPLIRELGSRAYGLIDGSRTDLENLPVFRAFLSPYPDGFQSYVRSAIIQALNPKSLDSRSLVIRYLNAYFFIEATNLSKKTIKALNDIVGRKVHFDVLVDTNFLFSLLGLHDNPANEAAASMLELIEKVSDSVEVTFHVSVLTVEEALGAIRIHSRGFKDNPIAPNLASAAMKRGLSGLDRKFIQEVQNVGEPLTAADFFRPYLTNLEDIIREKGIQIIPDDMSSVRNSNEIKAEISHQMDYEAREHSGDPKGQRRLEHDIVLWYWTYEHRPPRITSPLGANWWIVTIDYGYLGYDSYKSKLKRNKVPICLHPTTFIQLLQFWTPRTVEFEEAVLNSIRLPLLFQAYDPEDEKITIKMVTTIARYENTPDISETLLYKMMRDDSIRSIMDRENNEENKLNAVKNYIETEEKRLRQELERKNELVASTTAQVEDLGDRLSTASQVVEEKDNKLDELTQDITKEREKRQAAEDRVESLTTALAFVVSIFLVGVFIGAAHFIPIQYITQHPNSYGVQGCISGLIFALIFGIIKPKWRSWCLGVGAVTLLVTLFQIIGGPSQPPGPK